MNKDKIRLDEIANAQVSFTAMTKLLRALWVLDIDSRFEVILEDEETVASILILAPGVWEENKEIIQQLYRNKKWWNTYFDHNKGEKLYVFRQKV